MTETDTSEAAAEAPEQKQERKRCACGRIHRDLTKQQMEEAFVSGGELVRLIATGSVTTEQGARDALESVFNSAHGGEGSFWACLGICAILERKAGLGMHSGAPDSPENVELFTCGFDRDKRYLESDPEYAAAAWAARFYRASLENDMKTAMSLFAEHGDDEQLGGRSARGMAIWALIGTAVLAIRVADKAHREQGTEEALIHGLIDGLRDRAARGPKVRLEPAGITPDGAGITVNVVVGDSGGTGLGAAITELLDALGRTLSEETADAGDDTISGPEAGVRGPDSDAGPGDGTDGRVGEAPGGEPRD